LEPRAALGVGEVARLERRQAAEQLAGLIRVALADAQCRVLAVVAVRQRARRGRDLRALRLLVAPPAVADRALPRVPTGAGVVGVRLAVRADAHVVAVLRVVEGRRLAVRVAARLL